MKQIKLGLNGFGRIGRAIARIASEKDFISIEAINTGKTTPELLAYSLKYDSSYRTFHKNVTHQENGITIDDHFIQAYNQRDPQLVPWGSHNIDVVIDCTGVFKDRESLSKHLRDSVKKVILTVPAEDNDSIKHVVMGVNDNTFDWHGTDIISNASCTTNCAAVMVKVLSDTFGIESGFISTTHSYTSSQPTVDEPNKKFTRGRAAGLSIIPTTTGASKAVCYVSDMSYSSLAGVALRVPTPVGSITDLTCLLKRDTSVEEINNTYKQHAEGALKGILGFETTPLVSSDYIGNPNSCTFDANYTQVLNGKHVKVMGWYDNEWGYSARVVDVVKRLSEVM
jgi:glyceraldehyde 3-phosphate dehydrogenase